VETGGRIRDMTEKPENYDQATGALKALVVTLFDRLCMISEQSFTILPLSCIPFPSYDYL